MKIGKWFKLIFSILILVFTTSAVTYGQVNVNTPPQNDSTELADEEEINDDEFSDEIEPDSSFDEYLKSIGYGFDSTLIPAHNMYNHTWNTKKIHVYEQDLSKIKDTTMIVLQDTSDCYFHPPCFGHITSKFGYRRMRRRRGRMHYGTDVKLYKGDPVYSAFDGIVRIAQYSRSYGYVVVVRHYNGLETIYAHFSKLLTKPGTIIKAGDPIGLGGNTGRSYGSHLHFEVRFKGLPFDATSIINFETGKLISDTIYIDQKFLSHLKRTKYAGGSRYKGGKGSTKGAKYHRVRRGDTLGGIAVRYGTTITRLCRLNGIRRNSIIRIGQRIRIR